MAREPLTRTRAGFLVLFLAVAAYANSLPNGFAYDDRGIITDNPVVTTGDFERAAMGPWWQTSPEGGGLYRPLTALSFTLEWSLFGDAPSAFHGGNVLFHGVVSVLLFLLLLELGSLPGALAGGALFAIHPVHTEAVANVVGRAEVYSATFFLLACILYWRGREWSGLSRTLRLVGIGALYLFSLFSKEIGVTLPGVLLLLEVFAPWLKGETDPRLTKGILKEAPVFMLLPVVLLAYLGLRFLAIGSFAGDVSAPVFQLVSVQARVLTAVSLWGQYLRLLIFPLDLAADYDPGVFFPSEGFDLGVFVGAGVIVGLVWLTYRTWGRSPLVALGILWFFVCISPVSNLFFPTGTILAERTLYLPSIALSLVAAGLTARLIRFPPRVRGFALALAVVVGVLFFVRTVVRNPSWMSTFVVLQTLNDEHPESWRAFWGRARGLERVGEIQAASEALDIAVTLTPRNYTILAEAGDFHGRLGDWNRSQAYLRRAIEVAPELANAYQLLSGHLLRRGLGREGHGVALEGLTRAGPDAELWALVSESYLLKGDLPAAVRAREVAIVLDPEPAKQWERMGEIWEAMGEMERAREAWARAKALEDPSEEVEGSLP
jgi:hypothetical protein